MSANLTIGHQKQHNGNVHEIAGTPNITPRLLSTTSKIAAPNGCTWASATSNLALATPAAAASRRASATWIREKSAPRACPLRVARAARMVISPQPHPTSRTFSPSSICAAASNRARSRPSIRSCRSRCSMNSRPLAPFQSLACSAFTATNDTLLRPQPCLDRCRCAVRYVIAGDRDGGGGMPERRVLRAAARLIDTATDHPESAGRVWVVFPARLP